MNQQVLVFCGSLLASRPEVDLLIACNGIAGGACLLQIPHRIVKAPEGGVQVSASLLKRGVAEHVRYAELVCVSDDPGEAAANYVVLKLMGYPDVKVLLM